MNDGDKICTDCGEPMELREGKHGMFWGCTAYPECKYTEKADEEEIEGWDENNINYKD